MNTIQENLLTDLKRTTLPGLTVPQEFILPAYQDQSVLNIPASICAALGLAPIHGQPLRSEIQEFISGEVKRIILVLMDALSFDRFAAWLGAGKIPVWEQLLQSGILAPITSITPSTTSTAMTTLWTGRSPAEHGVAGYELWLKQYGVVANMILQSPMSFKGNNNGLEHAGFNPEAVLEMPTLGQYLLANGISAYSFQHYSIAHSGLSRTFMKDVSIVPFGTDAECWVNLRSVIERRKNERLFLWTYWGSYDGLSHRYGPDDERAELYFTNFSQMLAHNLINRLPDDLREGTLLILTADHGQVFTPKQPQFNLIHHPEFMNQLHIKPTGENRLAYLHVKPGMENSLKAYAAAAWPGQFILYDSQSLLQTGLFGPGIPMADIHNRIGDVTMIAKGDNYLWWSEEDNPLLGRHGGLTAQEMIVPYLTAWL